MVALVAALGENHAVIVGHDWGAPVAWHPAMFRPDIFTAVAGHWIQQERADAVNAVLIAFLKDNASAAQ
jgi:pimeloyl-ACP methyl ester carboxylesterase